MLKTLNTITSLISNEGLTGAVTRSLQAMERSFEARITGVRNDFARMLDERMNRAHYEAQTERQKMQETISRAETAVSRVDNMLDVVTKLRMQASDSARVAEGAGRVAADRLEAALTRLGELTAKVETLEAKLLTSDDAEKRLNRLEANGIRVDRLWQEYEARAFVHGSRLDKWESSSERSNDHIAARYEQQLDTIFERLDKLESHAPLAWRLQAENLMGDLAGRISALETQAGEVRNAFGRRLAALESQVAVLVSQSASPCEGVNELRSQLEDVAYHAEMRFKSFDNVWQDLARSVSALTSKIEAK